MDHFDRPPGGAALISLQEFGVLARTPFFNYTLDFGKVVAGSVEKGCRLAPSTEIAILRLIISQG